MSVSDIRKKRKNGEELDGQSKEFNNLDRIREKRKQGIELEHNAINNDFSRVSNGNVNKTIRNNKAQTPSTDLTSRRNPNSNREIYRKAIELVKNNTDSSEKEANAGNDRTTALKLPSTQKVWGGYGTLPNPATQGINTASNGADVNTEKFKTEETTQKGWKGLGKTFNNWLYANNAGETEEEYSAKQHEVYDNLDDETKNALATMHQAQSEITGFSNQESYGPVSQAEKDANQRYFDAKKVLTSKGYTPDEINNLIEVNNYITNQATTEEMRRNVTNDLQNGGVKEHAFYNAADLIVQPVAGLAATGDAIFSRIQGKRIDTNSPNWMLQNMQTQVEQTESELIKNNLDKTYGENSFAGKAGQFVYGTGMSLAKSWESLLMGGAVGELAQGLGASEKATRTIMNLVTLPNFGGSAFASTFEDARKRGLNDNQAFSLSVVAGLAEMGTEVFSLDNVWDILKEAPDKQWAKKTVSDLIAQTLIEGSEEGAADIINALADDLIAADQSEFNTRVQEYISAGLSEEEAKRKATQDAWIQIGQDVLAGAISGGITAGGATATKMYKATKGGKQIKGDEEFVNQALNDTKSQYYIPAEKNEYKTDEDYEQALKARALLQNAQDNDITNKQARELYDNVVAAEKNASEGYQARVIKEITEEFNQRNEKEAIEELFKASTPSEIETIKETNNQSSNVVQAAEEKKAQMIQEGKATEQDFTEAVTPVKAREMAKSGQEIAPEELEKLPAKVQQAYDLGYSERANDLTSDVTKNDITEIKLGEGEYQEIKSVSADKNGVVTFETQNGETIKASDATFTDKGKYLYEGKNGILSLDKPALIQMAIDIENSSKHGIAVGNVTNALKQAYTLGESGLDFNASDFLKELIGEENLKKAYEEGKKVARSTSRAAYAKKGNGLIAKESKENSAEYKKQFADEKAQARYENEVTDTEKRFLELLSNKIGVDIEFTLNDKSLERGHYEPSEGKIYLNLAAGKNMFEVALHEAIGEFMAASNEEAYNQIADSVLNAYAATNSTALANRIKAYQQAYSDDVYGNTARGASRELFNDALGEIFSSEANMQKMFNWLVTNEGETQANKVKKTLVDYLKDIVNFVKQLKKEGFLNTLASRNLKLTEEQASKYADQILKAMDQAIANRDAGVVQQAKSASRNARLVSNEELSKIGDLIVSTKGELPSEYKYNQVQVAKISPYIAELINKISYGKIDASNKNFALEAGKVWHEIRKHSNMINENAMNQIAYTQKDLDDFITTMERPDYIEYSGGKYKGDQREAYIVAKDINGRHIVSMAIGGKKNPNITPEMMLIFTDAKWNDFVNSGVTLSEYLYKGSKRVVLNKEDLEISKKNRVTAVSYESEDSFPETSETIPHSPLDNSIASEDDNATTNPAPKSINVEKLENTARHSFAGIGAETANMHQLNIASDMMDEGIDEEVILASTGWFKGLDNKWKFEIPDNDLVIFKDGNAKFLYGNPDFKRYNELMDKIFYKGDSYTEEEYEELGELEEKVLLKTKEYGNLADFIKHDKLFDAYPFLYGTYVDFVDFKDESIKGAADIKNNGIHLNENFHKSVNPAYSSNAMKSVLLHEIQHLIQQYEDFANGASPTWWNDIKQERIEADEKNLAAAQEYLDRAIKDAKERGLPSSVENYIFDLSEQLDNNEITPEEYRKAIAKFKKSKVYHYSDMVRKLERHLRRLRNDSNELLYWNTAGEIEARDVQHRMSLTEQERKEQMPKNYDSDVVYTEGSTAQRRYSIKVDTEGRELSEGQKEYFKDSKVVDEEGRLRVVYHGTMADFTIFDLKEARDTEDIEAFFFSGDVEEAEGYGNLGEYYLNITNPADYKIAYDIFFKYKGKEHAGKLAREELQSMGYDGVIAIDEDSPEYTEYLAFDSNQIKRVDNLNPTASEDIRYSISVGEDRIYNYRGIEIVQNPSNKEYQQMRADIIKERPWMDGPDTILLRHTYDEDGNTYYWDAYAGMHRDIEPAIAEHWKTRVNQQWEWWKDEDKDFWANRSFSRYSKAVFGEESQYSSQIEQTQFVSQILSTLNNQLKGTSVSMKYIDETVKYILDKYDADLNPDDFKMELSQFIAYMTANEQVDYNQMMNYLLNVGDEVIQASRLKDPEEERIYSELKKELSSHKINLTEVERKELISKYGGSWNAVFGKLNAAGIKLNNAGQHMDGGTYSEIVDRFREIAGVQLDEEKTAVDQIATILDAMDALKPSAYQWEGATDMDKALDVATTIIDRYYSMATAIKESNIVKGTEKGAAAVERAKKNEIKKLRAKQEEYKAKVNAEFQQLVEDRKKVIQEQQEFYKRQAEIEKNFRGEKREFNKKANMSQKELEKTARLQAQIAYQGLKDTEAKKKNKDNIVRTCMRLINWMNKPTDTRHVPTFLKPALTEMIKSINFMPASMRKGDDGTISAIKWQESMRKLQQVLQGISNADAESLNDSDKYELSLVMEVDEIVNKMQQLLDKYNGTADISRMRPEDLKTLSDIMKSISESISHMNENFMNRRFKHVSEAARTAMNEMNDLKPISNTMGAVKSTLSDFLNLDMAEPITFFEELGSASESIMQEFFDGEKIGIEIIEEADNFFNKLANDLGLSTKDIRAWENDAKDYKFGGVPITLTTADLMSLYCSYNREKLDQEERPFEATHHIAAGGIKGFRHRIGLKEVNRNPQVAHVTEADVVRLLDNLTETQKQYADMVVKYMSTTLAEHGNKTSNKLNGYSKFLGKYYFPLKTDNNAIATTESNNTSDQAAFRRLIFPSFTKSQIDKADNALVIMNFFDVVTEHITGMSNYCAYAMPISDAMRWYNYAETERANTEVEDQYQRYTTSVKGCMDRVRGDEARKYFENFIRDVNLDNKAGGSKASKLISQGLTGLAKAKAVGLNIRVIVQQPCAIIRAADVIEGKYLAEGWAKMSKNPKAATEYAQNKSYLCYWKSKGFSDTRVSQSMKEIITGQESLRQDIVEKTGALAGLADDITWASMYYAAEAKIEATTDLVKGTEEFDAAVEELFSDIINHTQVIDSQLRKTGTMRSNDAIEKLANAFKKEPQKSYNMLHRAYWKVYQDPTSEEAKKGWKRAVTIFVENAFVTAIAQSLVDAWRDDDEEDSYLVKMLKKMLPYDSYATVKDFVDSIIKGEVKAKDVLGLIQGIYGGAGNILDNANIASSVPYIADIDSLLKGYSVTRLDSTSILTQLKNTVTTLGSTNATPYSIIYSLAQLVGYGTGVGVDNALRDLRGIYNQFLSDITGVRIEKNAATAKKNAKKKEQREFSAIYESNDMSTIKNALNDIHDKAIESGKAEKDAWNAVRDALEAEYKKQIAEHPEDLAAINNRFTTLLKYTKYDNGTRAMSDKEIKNKLDSWSKSE